VYQTRPCVARRRRDRSRPFSVDGRVRPRFDGSDDAGEMNDGIDARETSAQRVGVERRDDRCRARRRRMGRPRTDDGLHRDATRDQIGGDMASDESGGAGNGDRTNHKSAFW
jgi:hypothetical protein